MLHMVLVSQWSVENYASRVTIDNCIGHTNLLKLSAFSTVKESMGFVANTDGAPKQPVL